VRSTLFQPLLVTAMERPTRTPSDLHGTFDAIFILGLETRTLSGEFVSEDFILSVVGGIQLSCHSVDEIPKRGRNANRARRFRLTATYFCGATSTLKNPRLLFDSASPCQS
jgi:hypothetical protein